MARQLKLVRRDDFISDVDYIDLLLNPFGIVGTAMSDLAVDGYQPVSAPIGARSVHETITLKLLGATKDDLAGLIQDLDAKVKQVQWWIEDRPAERYGVWLRAQLEGETYARQALILNIQPPDKVKVYNPPEMYNSWVGDYTIAIERAPFWEDVTTVDKTSAITISGNIGGAIGWGNTVYGDAPARLARFTADITAHGTTDPTAAWFGFKTSRYGDPANFVPYWPLASAPYLYTDTSTSNDGHGRSIIQCDFSSATVLTKRAIIQVNDVASTHPADQRGAYTVLLATKVDAATVCRMRIAFANSSGTIYLAPTYRSRVVVNEIFWTVHEMGSMTIPASYFRTTDSISKFTLSLDVERLSGAGKFYAYGFFLIPQEGMIKFTNTAGSSISDPVTVFRRPDDNIIAHEYATLGYSAAEYIIQNINWSVPANDEAPYLIGAIDQGQGGASDNTIAVTYQYIKRWRTLRGNE